MKKNQFKSLLIQQAEELAPSSDIDLWPSIKSHVTSNHAVLPQTSGGFKMKRAFSIVLPMSLALLLAVVFFTFTPAGKALAQQFISLFFTKEPDIRPFDWDNGTPIITPIANIAEGEALTGWHIYQPSWLPDGFTLNSTDYRPNSDRVSQSYTYDKTIGMVSSYFYIGQRKSPFNELWPVGESSQVETVKIGAYSGEYVIGAWGGAGDHYEWEAVPQIQHLRWQKDGTYFDLEFAMFGIDAIDLLTSPYYLNKEQLIAIAASMK
jgi:hypothetical protein